MNLFYTARLKFRRGRCPTYPISKGPISIRTLAWQGYREEKHRSRSSTTERGTAWALCGISLCTIHSIKWRRNSLCIRDALVGFSKVYSGFSIKCYDWGRVVSIKAQTNPKNNPIMENWEFSSFLKILNLKTWKPVLGNIDYNVNQIFIIYISLYILKVIVQKNVIFLIMIFSEVMRLLIKLI